MISKDIVGVIGIGSNADAMLLIAKGEVIGHNGTRCGMPEVNSTASLIIGDIILNIDRESTRLNSSHTVTAYAVFIFKKSISEGGDLRRTPTAFHSTAVQPATVILPLNLYSP